MQINGAGQLGSGNYAGLIVNNGTLEESSSANRKFTGAISGTGALTKDTNTSVLILTGSNTYSGATTLNAGTLQLQANSGNITSGISASLSNSSILTLASGTTLQLRSDSAVSFAPSSIATIGTANANNTLNIDAGELTGAGAGKTLTLSGGLTFATNSSGTWTDTVNVTSASGGDTLALGTISAASSNGGPYPFIINPTTAAVTIGSFVTASYGSNLTFTGSNTATLTNFSLNSNSSDTITVNGPTVILAGANTATGGRASGAMSAVLSSGTLDLNNSGALSNPSGSSTTTFAISGGTLDSTLSGGITVSASPIISLAGDFTYGGTDPLNLGTGNVTLNGAAGARTITTNGTTNALTIGGAISSGTATALTKAGNGTLTLSSAGSTYGGGTTLSAGTLYLGASSTTSSGTVTQGPIGTGTLTVAGNATLGTPAGANLSNPIALNSGVTLTLSSVSSAIALNGAITGPSNSTLNEVDANRDILDGSLAGFSGTIEETGSVAAGIYVDTPAFNGQNVAFVANSSVSYSFLPTTTAATSTFYMGSLAGNNSALLLRPASASVAGTLTLQIGTLNANTTYAGYIQDYSTSNTKIALTLVGGTLTLPNTGNSYTGGTTISGGTLVITADTNIGGSGTAVTLNGGTLSEADAVANNTVTNTHKF